MIIKKKRLEFLKPRALEDIFDKLLYDDFCRDIIWQRLSLCLGLIIFVPVLLVGRIWENVWESGCLEVKRGNCVKTFDKRSRRYREVEVWVGITCMFSDAVVELLCYCRDPKLNM